MKLRNTTTIPNDIIRAVVREVCPSNVAGFTIKVTNLGHGAYRGTAFISRNSVIIRVNQRDLYCRVASSRGFPGKGYLTGYSIGGRLEALIFTVAHELRHLWQKKVTRGWRVWGARGQYSERDADAYGLQMVRKFRRGEMPTLLGVTLGDCPKLKKVVPLPKKTTPVPGLKAA